MGIYRDRVRDTSTTTGTGNFTLSGTSPAGYRNFNTAFGTNVRFYYSIASVDGAGVPTGDWEVGEGYLSSSTSLVRDDIMASSNSGSVVSFSAGTKQVFATMPASEATNKSVAHSMRSNLALGY